MKMTSSLRIQTLALLNIQIFTRTLHIEELQYQAIDHFNMQNEIGQCDDGLYNSPSFNKLNKKKSSL